MNCIKKEPRYPQKTKRFSGILRKMNTKGVAFALVAVLILASFAFFAWQYYKAIKAPEIPTPSAAESSGLGAQIYKDSGNPTQKIPDANPFQAETNPFSDAKTNPYTSVYHNPF